MDMIERGRAFVQKVKELGARSWWGWKSCPHCGSTLTIKNGSYRRHPWTLAGRQEIRIQRHRCQQCGRSYAEESAHLVRGSWYAREVRRCAVDYWVHGGASLRRAAEWLRSWLGRQERWLMWQMAETQEVGREICHLSASTLHRWLKQAGRKAQESVPGQWAGVESSGQMGTDGLWARLRVGGKRVLFLLVDTVTGVVWATAVAVGEEAGEEWGRLFVRAEEAGLIWKKIDALVSDGAQGVLSFVRSALGWVHHQRCIWHFWRKPLAGEIAATVVAVAKESQEALRQELRALLREILNASSYPAAEEALARLAAHTHGARLAQRVNEQWDRLLYHLLPTHRGLMRLAPEWLWRDFRLRLSRGRNHGTEERLDQAGLVWMVYHNFTPAQWRSERKRKYKHAGQSPLQVAGAKPERISYLDALEV
jgi:transposase-like protein